jgi:CHAT domain-containing protein
MYEQVHLSPLQSALVRRRFVCAVIGSTLIAFTLCGSTWRRDLKTASSTELAFASEGLRLYRAGEYTSAGERFRSAALEAERDGLQGRAAIDWGNVGAAALVRFDFRTALPAFQKARLGAQASHQMDALAASFNNMADLYLQIGDPDAALLTIREALASLDLASDAAMLSRLHFHLAEALARSHRFDEAEPVFRQALREIGDQASTPGDLEAEARMLGDFGGQCLDAGRLTEAEDFLSEALRIVKIHRLNASANILRGLGTLKSKEGDRRSARALFDAALETPQGITPRWLLYADRAEFRLQSNNFAAALADFREARRLAAQVRADVVPADYDRVALSQGLNRIPTGLVEAGNRLAARDGNASLLRETFDAAEQDRLWSLRALVPSANDWRTRLPETYWDKLAQYQDTERRLLAQPSNELRVRAASLEAQLHDVEAMAAGSEGTAESGNESALDHARRLLDSDTSLFSFHLTDSSGWLWAVDRHGVDLYPIPAGRTIKSAIGEFEAELRRGDPNAPANGASLYSTLFGKVARRYTGRKRWLIVPDGPLFELPLSGLVTGFRGKLQNEPIYLPEVAAVETVPGASLLEPRRDFADGPFLGIGDAVYNAADSRYSGARGSPDVVLPRLAATAGELTECSRTWNPGQSHILTGADASLQSVRNALNANPAVIHFATHILKGAGFFSSGLIALSLNPKGEMGLMGPAEIAARPVKAGLVVLNGCHSGQAESVPGVGLMGLTRAWIGAGAGSVLATQWDIPDEGGAAMMVEFYRALRLNPAAGPAGALQQAQLRLMHSHRAGSTPAVWAAYFLVGKA